jgi:pimeloyl-ACP methyl ester carboxylesterase
MPESMTVHPDVVVLVPGFLGFSVLGRFPYFADRVPATLGALCRKRWGRPVSVVPASTVPAGKLRDRVGILASFLGRLRTLGAERFYLVGHSTGGVDAQLLMTKAPLWGNHRPADVERARDWVEAVVTVSAPHYGTSLLDTSIAGFVAHGQLTGALPFLRALGPLFSLAIKDMSHFGTILDLNTKQLPDAGRFIVSVLRHHELLDELRPHAMEVLRARAEPISNARVTCFVTGADVQRARGRKSDAFYAELNELGRTGARGHDATAVEPNVRRIEDADQALWIRNPRVQPFRIDVGTNDGVVNTARQLLPEAALGGVIVGDHADVIGDYDRIDIATEQPMTTGIFRSGASFGDDQFFELYGRIASALS